MKDAKNEKKLKPDKDQGISRRKFMQSISGVTGSALLLHQCSPGEPDNNDDSNNTGPNYPIPTSQQVATDTYCAQIMEQNDPTFKSRTTWTWNLRFKQGRNPRNQYITE